MLYAKIAVVVTGLFALVACGGGSDDESDLPANTVANTASIPTPGDTVVTVQTSMGSFEITLFEDDSPITTENFLDYVDSGFFDGDDGDGATVFHRVVDSFVIQGGGVTAAGVDKDTESPIENEAIENELSNIKGTVAMARTTEPDTATSQFFVNLVDNLFLDPGESTFDGYAVFGEVSKGMGVVQDIGDVAVNVEAPIEDVIIEAMTY